jgi:hypothetical protein
MSFEVGDKVWAQQFGEGVVTEVYSETTEYPIHVLFGAYKNIQQKQKFTWDGKHSVLHLRPSLFHAGTRIIPAPEPEREKPEHEFKPFDKVLVRDENLATWVPKMCGYGKMRNGLYRDLEGLSWVQCIPYEGNEHLCGTKDAPGEKP